MPTSEVSKRSMVTIGKFQLGQKLSKCEKFEKTTGTFVRDDFSKPTINEIAMRAGNLCSNPECQFPTSGPKQGNEGFVNIGVAAHITAAAPGGPRYDATLTTQQRRHQSNGIWLCQIHAKHVDSDEQTFTVEILRAWKGATEARRFRHIVTLQATQEHQPWSSVPFIENIELLKQLGLSTQDDPESVKLRVSNAAETDLAAL
jgi:hypothetical protein